MEKLIEKIKNDTDTLNQMISQSIPQVFGKYLLILTIKMRKWQKLFKWQKNQLFGIKKYQ